MTATTSATTTSAQLRPPRCRPWCDQGDGCVDGYHQHVIVSSWQQYPGGPSLSLALEDHDDDGSGVPSVAISYSSDGEIADGCVTIPLAHGRELAYSLLQAIARAEGPSLPG